MNTVSRAASSAAGIYLIVLLGILTAFDSMAIDMYLPAFPVIQQALGGSAGEMQASLSVFLIGLAIGQAVLGPLIDRYGRRMPLIVGIAVFMAGSAWVALSSDMASFIGGRFLQGIGGAAGLVIPRAIVSDLYDSNESAKIYSVLMQIMSIAPIVAPPLGGVLLTQLGWEAIFWSLAVIGVLTLIASVRMVPETQPPGTRTSLSFSGVARSYVLLLGNRRYVWMTLSSGFIMGSLFTYISSSAFVFMSFFGLSSIIYSFVFAGIAVGMIGFGYLNIVLLRRMPAYRVLPFGLIAHFVCALALLLCVMAGVEQVVVVGTLIFVAVSSLSLIFGNVTAAAMFSAPPEQSGSASACIGVVQYVMAGLAGLTLGAIHDDGSLLPPQLLMTACAALAIVSWRIAVTAKKVSRCGNDRCGAQK